MTYAYREQDNKKNTHLHTQNTEHTTTKTARNVKWDSVFRTIERLSHIRYQNETQKSLERAIQLLINQTRHMNTETQHKHKNTQISWRKTWTNCV